MKYRELKNELEKLSETQLDCDVTIYDAETDEFYGVYSPTLQIQFGTDVLDDNHPYLTIREDEDD